MQGDGRACSGIICLRSSLPQHSVLAGSTAMAFATVFLSASECGREAEARSFSF